MTQIDVAIPIAFPDYLILVETPPVEIDLPEIPFGLSLPDKIKIPKQSKKVSNLGHAGIFFFQGSSGLTKYYEYGRYDPQLCGLVRKRTVPDVTIAKDGRPTLASLKNALSSISRDAGQNGLIKAAYIELGAGAFDKMLAKAQGREKLNTDKKRAPYEILTNSCLHFMKEVAEAGGARMPPATNPAPSGYLVLVRMMHNDLDYSATKFALEGVTLS